MKKTLRRQVVALLSAGATLAMATLVSASSSTQVAQLAPLVVPRTAHAATVLTDGRVLITGGRASAGYIVAVSEIFDPATGTSTASATLSTARVDHTATLLPDGRVLVAGGTGVSGSLASAEIFDPSNPAAGFQALSATMRAARARHTATLLNDGKVLIAGGDDAGTAEIFDPTTETFSSALLAMAAPRIGHTATLFSDDSVLLAGGNTDSMELFTPADQKFTLDPQKMSAVRTGHEAIELSDTRLLLFEGDTGNTIDEFNHSTDTLTLKDTLDGSASSATLLANGKILVLRADEAGLYAPDAADPSSAFTAFDETSVPGSSILPRSGQTATELSGDKKILVAGGVNTQNQSVVPALFNPARIWTDKDDYQPGDPVVLSGSGWKANEDVYLYAVDSQTQAWTYGSTVAADANGGFVVNPYFIVQLVQDGVDFSVTAVGAQSAMQANVKFTDNVNFQSVTVGGQTGTATVGTAASPTYQVTATYSGSGTIVGDPVTLSFVGWSGTPPAGVSTSFSTTSVTNGSPTSTLTINTSASTPAGTYTFTVQGKNVPGTTRTATGTLVVGKATAAVTLGSLSQTYDGTPKSATATTTPPGLTVTFTYNGSSTPPTNAGSYTVVGTINDTNYSGNATGTLVIAKATPTVTVTGGTFTYDGNQHAATATAVGVDGHTAVSGSFAFTYTPPGTSTAPTNASATPYAVSAAFTSSNSNYNNTSGSASITINKATPTFSSPTPSQTITFGTATISVSGKLNAGSGLVPSGTATVTVSTASATTTGFTGNVGNFSATIDTHLIPASATPYTITYSYAGDSNFNSATNTSTTLTVNKAAATVTLASLSQTYDGTPKSATATTSPTGLSVTFTYNGSSTAPTNAGSYTVVATVNDNSYTGSATGTLVIAKANATISVTPYSVTYDGVSHMATGSAKGAQGETLTGLDLSGTTHTNAGDYPTDPWTFTDSTGNYNNTTGTTHDHIDKAAATIVVTPYHVTYDGNPHTATGTATGVGGANLSASLNLSGTTRTAAGDYPTDSWTFTNPNYNDQSGTVHDQIDKATATVTLGSLSQTYAGTPKSATATTTPPGLNVTFTYNGSATAPTNAGSYTVVGTINDANYSGSATGTLVIGKANATITVTPYDVTYDGVSHMATGSAKGIGGVALTGLDLGGTTHANAGTYTDTWTFTDGTGNYNDASSTVTDKIAKANATITVTAYDVSYDGNAHIATGSAKGINNVALSGLNLSGTTHTDAGTYTDTWTFSDPNGNYNDASSTVTDKISKADAVIDVKGYTGVYDGNAHGATGSAKGVKGEDLSSLLSLGATFTNVPGGTATWTFAGNGNYNTGTGTADIVISKADAVIDVKGYTGTYDGNAHGATGSATGVKGETLSGLDLSGTTHTNAGTYADTWTFTDITGNYNNASDTVTDQIDKANANITITPYNVTYDVDLHTATGSAAGVESPTPVDLTSLLHLGGTTHTNAGDYATDAWTFDGNGNYNATSGTVHDSIAKADASITVTIYHVTYDGNAHTATGSAKGVKGETLSGLNLSGTTHTNAGDYPADSWTFTNANYKDASGTVHDMIDKANAIIVVNGYTGIYDGYAHGASGSATGVESPTPANLSGLLSLGATFTNVPGGTAFWSFAGNINYKSASGSAAIVIAKANPNITVTPYSVTYNGLAHTAMGTAKGVLNEPLIGLDLSGTTHTNAGDYPADPWTFTDVTGNYNNTSGTVHDSIGKAPLTITAQNATTQYSDPVTFTVMYAGLLNGENASVLGGTLAFNPTSAAAQFFAPGAYTIIPSGLTSINYAITFKTGTLTVTQEDARVTYTGAMMVSTSSPTSSKATVTLSATVQDITAVPTDLAYDPYPGDIRNATVTFVNRDNGNAVIATVPVGLVSAGDTKTGTATYNWNVDIGSADSVQYTVGIIVGNYYTRNASADDTIVTVSLVTPGSINGGGYLVMQSSAGLYPGGLGTKNNFGFNVKNTKTGVKGNINTIVRNNGRVYQIKGNSMTSLATLPNSVGGTATFNGKSNIQDITDPLAQPISIDGNATLQVTMTDNGEPGANDTIAITVWNKSGGMWFSSNWSGTKTIEQKLGGGNLIVR